MAKKIILISLDWKREKDPLRSLGHGSILANLIAHNINVIEKSWAINYKDFNIEDVISFISLNADMDTFIAFGAFVWNETCMQDALSKIKLKKIPGKIVIGGPQISYLISKSFDIEDYGKVQQGILEALYPQADIFIRGYAELALVDLMLSKDPLKVISGVHYRNTKDDNSLGTINIKELPSPLLQEIIEPNEFLRWETKRGCPFRCAFCQHKSPEANRYYEFPIERVLQEAKWIISHPKINDIAIVDPTFNIQNTHYLKVLEELINLKYKGKISLQCRFEFVTDEFLQTVKELNNYARVVLEFGVQTLNDQEEAIIQRKNKHDMIENILNQCAQMDIEIEVSLIYGLPLQTVDSFIDSIQFLIRNEVHIIRAWPLMLLRGTELYENKDKYELKESDEAIPHVISSNSFTLSEYKKMKKFADSLQIYNQLPKEEQALWDVARQKTYTASLSYANAISFFKAHQNLLTNDYLIDMRHEEPALQRIYDEKFGVVTNIRQC